MRPAHRPASVCAIPSLTVTPTWFVTSKRQGQATSMSDTAYSIPDDLKGVWQRTLLQRGTDSGQPETDDATWVRRVLTGQWFVDIRLPAPSLQARRALPLTQLRVNELIALVDQQAHAGVVRFEHMAEGPLCTWLRRIDYQPPSQTPDAGWLMAQSEDELLEVGVHVDHNEFWQRLPGSQGRHIALAGFHDDGLDNGRRLLVSGQFIALARARPTPWPRGMMAGATLREVMLHQPDRALDWLDCSVAFGHIEEGACVIEHSTLPVEDGCRWPLHIERLNVNSAQVRLGDEHSEWRILEWQGPSVVMD